jgi:fructose-bisphosphate aldolase class II
MAKPLRVTDYNVSTTKAVVDMAHAIGVSGRSAVRLSGFALKTMKGDKEDGHGAEGSMTREQLLTDPGTSR